MENMSIDIKITQANSKQSTQSSKSISEDKKKGVNFSKLLDVKKSNVNTSTNTDNDSVESKLEKLIALLTKFSKSISESASTQKTSSADTNVVSDSLNNDTTDEVDADLLSMLSALMLELNSKLQNNDLTTSSDLSTKGKSEEQSKVSNILSGLVSKLDGQDINKVQSSSMEQLLQDFKKSSNEILNVNDGSKNKVVTEKEVPEVKEIKDLIETVLASVKSESEKSPIKTGETSKLENLLAKLTEVVDKAGKEISTKNSSQEVQTFVKPQLTMNAKSTYFNEQGSKDSQNSNLQTSSDEDKILRKISQTDDSQKTQSFGNLLTRVVSNQQESMPITKADNVVINKNNFTNDVIKTVKFMELNNMKELTVKIAPKELGEVIIKLTQEGSIMKATITTSNKEAYQLMNSNLQEINDKISNNNTSIHNFSVDVFNGEGSFLKQQSQQNKETNHSKKSNGSYFDEEEDQGIEAINNNDGNVNILV